MVRSCRVKGCSYNYYKKDLQKPPRGLFRAPVDPDLRQNWITAIGLEGQVNDFWVCSDHFEEKEINRTYESGRIHLHCRVAVPTLNLNLPDAIRRREWEEAIGPAKKENSSFSAYGSCVRSAHFRREYLHGLHYASGRVVLRKGAIPTLLLSPSDEDLPNVVGQRYARDVQPPVKTEDQFVDPLQSMDLVDPLQTVDPSQAIDPLSDTAPAMLPNPVVKPTENKETSSDIQVAGEPKVVNPHPPPTVKIICEICDEKFPSSECYRAHRLHEHEIIVNQPKLKPSPAVNSHPVVETKENKKEDVLQKALSSGLDNVMDAVIVESVAALTSKENEDLSDNQSPKKEKTVGQQPYPVVKLPTFKEQIFSERAPILIDSGEEAPPDQSNQVQQHSSALVSLPVITREGKKMVVLNARNETNVQLPNTRKDKNIELSNTRRSSSFKNVGPEVNFTCEICSRGFVDSVSFETHQKIHEIKAQIRRPKWAVPDSLEQTSKAKLPNTRMKVSTQANIRKLAPSTLKNTGLDVDNHQSQEQEFIKAKKIIQCLYQKMRSLLLENKHLKAIIKKHNPHFYLGKEESGGAESGTEVTDGLRDLDDIILRDAEGSFLEKLSLSHIENLGNVTSLVIEEDGTLRERIIGGPKVLKGETILGGPEASCTNQVDQIGDEESHMTDNNSLLKVESSSVMDTDVLFEIEFPENAFGNTSTPEKLENDQKKHACGMCAHRTATAEEMLIHIATHIEDENSEEVDEEMPNVEETVMQLTGDSTTQAYLAYETSTAQDTTLATNEEPQYTEECSEKCGPPKRKRQRLRPLKYFCDRCDYRCRYPSEMISHKLIKHNINTEAAEAAKNLVCGVCDYRTNNSANMTRHIATHTGEKKFACDQCDYKATQKTSVEEHKSRLHRDVTVPLPRSHKCDFCQYAATRRDLLKSHMRRVHKVVIQRPNQVHSSSMIKCEICDKKFSHRGTYTMHKKTHESNHLHMKELTCEICFKKVRGFGAYSMHKTACLKEADDRLFINADDPSQEVHICRSCGKLFETHQAGMEHNCSQPSMFHCTVCEFSCKQKIQLNSHMRIHTGERPYKCEECHARFRQHPHLKYHMKTHTGERPYSCRYCGKSFAGRTNMQSHEKIHTDEKPLECSFCDHKTRNKRSLRRHIESRHYMEEADLGMEDI